MTELECIQHIADEMIYIYFDYDYDDTRLVPGQAIVLTADVVSATIPKKSLTLFDFFVTKKTIKSIQRQDKIPIAKCAKPECGRTILYSKNPREKLNVTVRIAEPGYTGPTYRCAHCNTMFVVIEKPKVAAGYVALLIIAANA